MQTNTGYADKTSSGSTCVFTLTQPPTHTPDLGLGMGLGMGMGLGLGLGLGPVGSLQVLMLCGP